MVVVINGWGDEKSIRDFRSEGRVCSAGSSIEKLSDAVVSDEVVGDDRGRLGADTVGSGGEILAGSSDEELVCLEVAADGGLLGERSGP